MTIMVIKILIADQLFGHTDATLPIWSDSSRISDDVLVFWEVVGELDDGGLHYIIILAGYILF